ncbi:MAG TPA: hypothetical protein VGE26_11650 [Sphingobacteriaceae bacterium]
MEKLTFQTLIAGDLTVDVAEVEMQNQKDRSYRITNSDGTQTFISKNTRGQYYIVGGADLQESDVTLIGAQIEERLNRS